MPSVSVALRSAPKVSIRHVTACAESSLWDFGAEGVDHAHTNTKRNTNTPTRTMLIFLGLLGVSGVRVEVLKGVSGMSFEKYEGGQFGGWGFGLRV
eukprot:2407496-Rhodomonas_salina.1